MTKSDKEIFTESYTYKRFSFVIKVILRKQSLEMEGLEGDNSITSAKVFFNPLTIMENRVRNHLISDPTKRMMCDIKESLRFYADHKKSVSVTLMQKC